MTSSQTTASGLVPLAPEAQAFVDQANTLAATSGPAPVGTAAVTLARQTFGAMVEMLRGGPVVSPHVGRVHDEVVPGPVDVPVRVYEPGPESSSSVDVVVFIHGGGFISGDLDSYDHEARTLTASTGARVYSVDYRLAPEVPYPGPFDDCLAVLEWVATQPHRTLSIVGDSAGGNLAACVAIAARDKGIRLAAQLLVYPVIDPALSGKSFLERGEGYLLTTSSLAFDWDCYVPDAAQRADAYAAPGSAVDLAGVAPAVVTSAGYDPLRDDATWYAARLAADGVEVVLLEHPDLMHAYWQLAPRVPAAQDAIDRAFGALKELISQAAAEGPRARAS